MKRGQQRRMPAYASYRQVQHLIGALDWLTDQVHALPVPRKNTVSFLEFVEWLCLSVYPQEPLVLVLDKVSYHHSAPARALFSLLEPRVQVIWLPKYSPDMNPIERYWRHLKDHVYANRLFLFQDHLLPHIQVWLDIQNRLDHPLRMSFANSFR
jgi:putative transposase